MDLNTNVKMGQIDEFMEQNGKTFLRNTSIFVPMVEGLAMLA